MDLYAVWVEKTLIWTGKKHSLFHKYKINAFKINIYKYTLDINIIYKIHIYSIFLSRIEHKYVYKYKCIHFIV